MIVVKLGGGAGITSDAFRNLAQDMPSINTPAIVIHGANAEFSALSSALGHPPRMVTNSKGRVSRYTDRESLDIMLMAYCGKVNKLFVSEMQVAGINAVGLSAIDGRIATGNRKSTIRAIEDGKSKVLREDHAGTIKDIDPTVVRLLLENGYTPVLTPPALDIAEGVPINVDGDRLAVRLARELGAEALIFFSDTPGLLRDKEDESTLIEEIDASQWESALDVAQGRMKVKVEQAVEAVESGIGRVIFADGRIDQPISRALAGQGTVVSASKVAVS